MTVKFAIDPSELEAFQQAMMRMPDEIKEQFYEVFTDIGNQAVQRARAYAPVRTGALRMSIYSRVTRDLVWHFGAYVAYAVYQEYGTRYIMPKYFLTRALQETLPLLTFAMGEVVRQVWDNLPL